MPSPFEVSNLGGRSLLEPAQIPARVDSEDRCAEPKSKLLLPIVLEVLSRLYGILSVSRPNSESVFSKDCKIGDLDESKCPHDSTYECSCTQGETRKQI